MHDILQETPKLGSLYIHRCHHAKILKIGYKQINTVLSEMDGFGSAAYSVALVLLTSIFQIKFKYNVAKQIKIVDAQKQESIREIEEILRKRISYLSLYSLHDRVVNLENSEYEETVMETEYRKWMG